MQTYINSYLVKNNSVHTFKIFGYSSMGMPGVEVIGMGRQNRLIKEKVLYATKLFHKKLKNRRYVLCLEQASDREVLKEDYFWFEIPTLILLWTLGGVLPLMNIHECYCSGKIGAEGQLSFYPYIIPELVNFLIEKKYKAIHNQIKLRSLARRGLVIDLEEFIANTGYTKGS